jgi:hypothetical protein
MFTTCHGAEYENILTSISKHYNISQYVQELGTCRIWPLQDSVHLLIIHFDCNALAFPVKFMYVRKFPVKFMYVRKTQKTKNQMGHLYLL